MESFAKRLRLDRERVGLTVRQLADQSGISFSYITKIETGRSGKRISPAIVSTLAKVLECDALEYMYLSDIVPPPLNELISDEQSRHILQGMLQSRSANGPPGTHAASQPRARKSRDKSVT